MKFPVVKSSKIGSITCTDCGVVNDGEITFCRLSDGKRAICQSCAGVIVNQFLKNKMVSA